MDMERLWAQWHSDDEPLRVGVSSCLLGEEVRFDGGHARDRYVHDVLGSWFTFVRVCPEVEVGMTTPRPTIRLIDREDETPRLVAPSTGEDFTDRMERFSRRRVGELQREGLDGFVVKKSSPSCGLERIRVYRNGMPSRRNERGVFTRHLVERWPDLPIEEEGRLNDPGLRENFIERVFARHRWRQFAAQKHSRGRLVAFHTAHKMLLRAHNEAAYRRMGKLVAGEHELSPAQLQKAYAAEFHAAMATRATVKKHVNVMQHALGYLKRAADPIEKQELQTVIEDYRQGFLPLVVPLTLLRSSIRRHGVSYLADQLYFDPHPKELMLRNHV